MLLQVRYCGCIANKHSGVDLFKVYRAFMRVDMPGGLAWNNAVCFNTVQTAVKDSKDSGEEPWLVKTRCLLPSRVAANSAEVSQRLKTSFCRLYAEHSDGNNRNATGG